tara:strand:+ start:2431 stop:4113 length:1683 start_codon:yes stop_codon:yes gene_type:complete
MSLLFNVSARATDLERKRREKEKTKWWEYALPYAIQPVAQEFSRTIGEAIDRGGKQAYEAYKSSDSVKAHKRRAASLIRTRDDAFDQRKQMNAQGLTHEEFYGNKIIKGIVDNKYNEILADENAKYTVKSFDVDTGEEKEEQVRYTPETLNRDRLEAEIRASDEFKKQKINGGAALRKLFKESDDIAELTMESTNADIDRAYTGRRGFGYYLNRAYGALTGTSVQEMQNQRFKELERTGAFREGTELLEAKKDFDVTNDRETFNSAIEARHTAGKHFDKTEMDPRFTNFTKKYTVVQKVVGDNLVKFAQTEMISPDGRTHRVTSKLLDESLFVTGADGTKRLRHKTLNDLGTVVANAGFTIEGEQFVRDAIKEATQLEVVGLHKTGTFENYKTAVTIIGEAQRNKSLLKDPMSARTDFYTELVDTLAKSEAGHLLIRQMQEPVSFSIMDDDGNIKFAPDKTFKDPKTGLPVSEEDQHAEYKNSLKVREGAIKRFEAQLSLRKTIALNRAAFEAGLISSVDHISNTPVYLNEDRSRAKTPEDIAKAQVRYNNFKEEFEGFR